MMGGIATESKWIVAYAERELEEVFKYSLHVYGNWGNSDLGVSAYNQP